MMCGMKRKFREWLIKVGGGESNGAQTRAAEITGLRQAYISKVLSGHLKGSIGLERLQQVAEHMDVETWRIVWAIETGSMFEPPDPDSLSTH